VRIALGAKQFGGVWILDRLTDLVADELRRDLVGFGVVQQIREAAPQELEAALLPETPEDRLALLGRDAHRGAVDR
jgi:hypothetical protein